MSSLCSSCAKRGVGCPIEPGANVQSCAEHRAVAVEMNESSDPGHYKFAEIECIDAIRAMLGKTGFSAYLRGTITKYNWRFGRKDDSQMEASKVKVYSTWLADNEADRPLTKP